MELVKMSSKGQIVIPQDIRKRVGATEGTMFVVVDGAESIILKKITMPHKEAVLKELEKIARLNRTRLEKIGFTESDLKKLS